MSRPPAPFVRKSGPESRIQQSLTGIEPMTVTVAPHLFRAAVAFAEPSAHMMTNSCFAISLASVAISPWIFGSSLFPQMETLDGHAIHVRVGTTSSPGTHHVAAPAGNHVTSDWIAVPPSAIPAAARPVRTKNPLRETPAEASCGPRTPRADASSTASCNTATRYNFE